MDRYEDEMMDDDPMMGDDPMVDPMEEMRQQEEQEAMEREMRDAINALGLRLQQTAEDCINRRQDVERRWIEDLRQYNGLYDEDTQERLKKGGGSKLFVNITRPKCTIAEARLADMLFPTDEKNWGIKPTPNPIIDAMVGSDAPVADPMTGQPIQEQDIATVELKKAKDMAQAMEREIHDQLEEANYTIKARDVIHDAVIYGTGILKAPCIIGRQKRRWSMQGDTTVLEIIEDVTPTVERVDIWDFFPDMSASRIEDCEYVLQRHYLNRKQLADLKRTPAFMGDAIDELLTEKPTEPMASYREELRSISGITGVQDKKFEVWEYHGAIDVEDLALIVGEEVSEADVSQLEAVVFFCQGKVIKAMINPMETEDRPYSVFNWEEDDASIFGFGIPYLLRTPQKSINSTYRMAMDNGGLTLAPQIVVNSAAVRPTDGKWTMTPRKVWELTDRARSVNEVFGTFNIDSRLNELVGLYNQAREMADELVNLPLIAQGDQAPHLTQTAKGMSILMNAANTVMRRAVKNWDDDVTKPMLTRFYDWNMQFSEKQEIKGDLFVVARGTSAMLEREAQTEKLMGLMNIAPAFGGLIKMPEVGKKLVQAMNLPAEELIMSEQEIAQMQQQSQQQPNPEQLKAQVEQAKLQSDAQKIQVQAQNNQMDYETERSRQQLAMAKMQADMQLQQQKMQMELQKMAYERGVTIEQLRAQLGMKQMEIQSQEKMMAAELQAKAQFGSGI